MKGNWLGYLIAFALGVVLSGSVRGLVGKS